VISRMEVCSGDYLAILPPRYTTTSWATGGICPCYSCIDGDMIICLKDRLNLVEKNYEQVTIQGYGFETVIVSPEEGVGILHSGDTIQKDVSCPHCGLCRDSPKSTA
jgi:hypothetical protein